VAETAVRIAAGFGLPADRMRELRLGALLHDLGKIAIPDAILRKSGTLTAGEYEIMKTHPRVGAELCQPLQSLRRVIPIIRSHHERLDGSGYPDGLAATQIPLEVRIVSVSDVYDALTTERPYRPGHPPARAVDMLRSEVEKGWWDGDVVEELARLQGSYSRRCGLVRAD
jgi:putative two-component system response regulator